MATENWFSVRLLFVSDIEGAVNDERLCEESIVVVKAADEESARLAAERVAVTNESEYPNDQGEKVRWRFVRVLEIQDLCEATLTHGAEVWSKMFYESQTRDPDIVADHWNRDQSKPAVTSATPIVH